MKKLRRGLLIGRFQPIHKGHVEAIKNLMEKVDELVIIIGSSQLSHDLGNPFTTGERVWMVKSALNEAEVDPSKYLILPVPDAAMHSVWVAKVISYSPPFDVVFSNDTLTRRLFEEADVDVEEIRFFQRKIYSATEVRRRMLAGENWKKLLPKSVVKIINEVEGVRRLRELAATDSPFGRKRSVS